MATVPHEEVHVTNRGSFARLVAWASGYGVIDRIGIEGTGSWGPACHAGCTPPKDLREQLRGLSIPKRVALVAKHGIGTHTAAALLVSAGDRDANAALYQIALTRSSRDEDTKLYLKRRIAEGKTKKEAFRCLKRYIAREVHKTLVRTPALQGPLDT